MRHNIILSLFITSWVLSAQQSKSEEAPKSYEDQVYAGLLLGLVEGTKDKSIPMDLTKEFARCYAGYLASLVDPRDAEQAVADHNAGRQSDVGLEMRLLKQIAFGLSPAIISGQDVLGARCRDTAVEYRSYL